MSSSPRCCRPNNGQAHREADRTTDLSGQLLSPQGASREGHVPDPGRPISGSRAGDDGGVTDAAGSRPEDREPGPDSGVPEREEHLRRYARAPDFKSAGVGGNPNAGRDRTGALCGDRPTVVAGDQPVPGDVGTERLPTGISTLRRVRDPPVLPADRRQESTIDDRRSTIYDFRSSIPDQS
jgi:hypothetical protein